MSRPLIEQQTNEGWTVTIAGIGQTKGMMPESTNIEEYKYIAYVPLRDIPNSNTAQAKYFEHTQNPSKNGLTLEFIYGRPMLFIQIYFISIIFMFLITYLSYPLSNKGDIKQYFLTIGSIWAGQEGVSFLQGHRPLSLTLYDYTIVFILTCVVIIYRKPLFLKLKSLIPKRRIIKNNKKLKIAGN